MSKEATEQTCEPWSEYRWRQWERLEMLLNDCRDLDHGSGMMARLTRIIESAGELDKLHLCDTYPGSLMSFLRDQARYHYKQQQKSS